MMHEMLLLFIFTNAHNKFGSKIMLQCSQLSLARLMGQYCFARLRLWSSITKPTGGTAAAGRVCGRPP